MTTTNVQAVVFDLDGVLIDSEGVWDEVRRGVVGSAGCSWPVDATTRLQGMSTAEWSTYLSTVVGVPGTPPVIADTVIDLMAARYLARLPLIAGAVETVHRIGARFPLGLASSSPRRLIDAVLLAADLTAAFAITRSTEEVAKGKPSPLVYQAVVALLGTDPGRTVAIEDSSNGLRSAAAAGLRVAAVPQPSYPPAADALALATLVVADLSELTLPVIESLA